MGLVFTVVSSSTDPFVSLECSGCGDVIDSADAQEHADMHEAMSRMAVEGGES